jgi:hypothetical protein
MSFEPHFCGVPTETKNGRLQPCWHWATDNNTCSGHKGFYDPQRWLDWLDRKTGGDISPIVSYSFDLYGPAKRIDDLYWLHMVSALKSGRVAFGAEHMKFLPSYVYDLSTHKGCTLALMLYETQAGICREWSPRLWERVRKALLYESMAPFNSKCILQRAIRTPQDFCLFFRAIPLDDIIRAIKMFRNILELHEVWVYDDEVKKLAIKCGLYNCLEIIRKTFEVKQQTLAKKCVSIFKEELVARAWHPDRFVDWCLDLGEKADWLAA